MKGAAGESEVKQAVYGIKEKQLSASQSLTLSMHTDSSRHCGSQWKAVHL